MTTRSTLLGRAEVPASGNAILFQVPSGWVVIFKTLSWSINGAAASTLKAWIQVPSTNLVLTLMDQSVTAGWSGQLQTWLMMNAEDYLVVTAGAAAVTYWASGTLLPAPPPQVVLLPAPPIVGPGTPPEPRPANVPQQ